MKMAGFHIAGVWMAFMGIALLQATAWAHVTLRPSQPLQPGRHAVVRLVVPNERHVATIKVSVEVPDAFLRAGGEISRVAYPPGWEVSIEKENKPSDIYRREMDQRAARESTGEEGEGHAVPSAQTEEERQEEDILNELRKKWVKKVNFAGGSIPPDGFEEFAFSFFIPEEPGTYHFPAVQVYADGKEVSWSELVEGAGRPAAAIVVERQYGVRHLAVLLGVGLVMLFLVVQPHKRYKNHRIARSDSSRPVK